MPHSNSAKKRLRQNAARREQNRQQRGALRTQRKRLIAALAGDDQEVIRTEYLKTQKALDKAVAKGLIKKNTAGRNKSRLSQKVNAKLAS